MREKCSHLEFSGPYFPSVRPNPEKYGAEKLQIQCLRSVLDIAVNQLQRSYHWIK